MTKNWMFPQSSSYATEDSSKVNAKEKQELRVRLDEALKTYSDTQRDLLGIKDRRALDTLIEQIVDSIQRVKFVELIASRAPDSSVVNPGSPAFDPVKASVLQKKLGNFDDACWLCFLAIMCGKELNDGWLLVKQVYGGLTTDPYWTWNRTSTTPAAFTDWHQKNYTSLTGLFGNHRKYASKDPKKKGNIAESMFSYIAWVDSYGGHRAMFQDCSTKTKGREEAFARLYREMDQVVQFGRLGKFDFLTMIAKLGLAELEPDLPYITSPSGPLDGTKLLLGNSKKNALSASQANSIVKELGKALPIDSMVMQVMEDALCNWQKSQMVYIHFRG
jgi:hypothetical protein